VATLSDFAERISGSGITGVKSQNIAASFSTQQTKMAGLA
jgi:hypothetical protein